MSKEFRMCWEIYLKSQKFSSVGFSFFVLFVGALRQEVGMQHLTEPHLNWHAFVCVMRLIWQDQETKVTPAENVSKFCHQAPACESSTTTLTVFHYTEEIEVKNQAKQEHLMQQKLKTIFQCRCWIVRKYSCHLRLGSIAWHGGKWFGNSLSPHQENAKNK